MSEWQDPWDSPQLFAPREPWEDERIKKLQQQRAARMAARYYCPACGEVGYGYQSAVKGWVVDTHTRCEAAEGRHDYYYRRCPGGPIDPKKDKAP